VDEVIVVDDGSTDDTAERAEAAGATAVLRAGRNEGKGAAMNRGWKASRGEVLLFLDGDLGSSAAEAEQLLPPVLNGEADVTLAIFPPSGKKGGMGTALKLARWGVRRMTGRTVTAPLSGQRAMRREVAERLGGFSPGYSVETGMTIDLLRAGFRLTEVPTRMTHKVTGRDAAGFRHRGRQLLHIAVLLLKKSLRRKGLS
jgi:glycosyltransferase involved in cell wall biosynthesis